MAADATAGAHLAQPMILLTPNRRRRRTAAIGMAALAALLAALAVGIALVPEEDVDGGRAAHVAVVAVIGAIAALAGWGSYASLRPTPASWLIDEDAVVYTDPGGRAFVYPRAEVGLAHQYWTGGRYPHPYIDLRRPTGEVLGTHHTGDFDRAPLAEALAGIGIFSTVQNGSLGAEVVHFTTPGHAAVHVVSSRSGAAAAGALSRMFAGFAAAVALALGARLVVGDVGLLLLLAFPVAGIAAALGPLRRIGGITFTATHIHLSAGRFLARGIDRAIVSHLEARQRGLTTTVTVYDHLGRTVGQRALYAVRVADLAATAEAAGVRVG